MFNPPLPPSLPTFHLSLPRLDLISDGSAAAPHGPSSEFTPGVTARPGALPDLVPPTLSDALPDFDALDDSLDSIGPHSLQDPIARAGAAAGEPMAASYSAATGHPWRVAAAQTQRILLTKTRAQVDAQIHQLLDRCGDIDVDGPDGLARAAVLSRLDLIVELAERGTTKGRSAADARHELQQLSMCLKLLQRAQAVFHTPAFLGVENLRRISWSAAQASRLPPRLDPGFLSRAARVDLTPPDRLSRDIRDGDNPFLGYKPRFSCWFGTPIAPAVSVEPMALTPISETKYEEVVERLDGFGTWNGGEAAGQLKLAPGAQESDVDAVVDQWLNLSPSHLELVANASASVVVLRAGTPAARQVFGHRPAHAQALFDADTARLFVAVQREGNSEGGRPQLPSAQPRPDSATPAAFWTELGRLVIQAAWLQSGTTFPHNAPLLPEDAGRQPLERPEKRYWDDCHLGLPSKGFLNALVTDARDDRRDFPLGASEEDTRAMVVGRHLSGERLPYALKEYVTRRVSQHTLV